MTGQAMIRCCPMIDVNQEITDKIRKMIEVMKSAEGVEPRARDIAVTKLEECGMWWQRAVTRGHAAVSVA